MLPLLLLLGELVLLQHFGNLLRFLTRANVVLRMGISENVLLSVQELILLYWVVL